MDDLYVLAETASIVERLLGFYSNEVSRHDQLRTSATDEARALSCLKLRKKYESKVRRLDICKNQIRDMFMLKRAEEAAAPNSSKVAQEDGTRTSAADVKIDLDYQPNECMKQTSTDNAAVDDAKMLMILSEENLLSATSDQVKLCMKLAWNLILHTVLSQQIIVEEDHAKYFYVVKEESSKRHHIMKKLACERQVMTIEKSDVSIYYELMSLGVENGAAMWRKLLGSGAALIEAVEKVIITNDSGKETFETIKRRGILKLRLPFGDGTHSLNEEHGTEARKNEPIAVSQARLRGMLGKIETLQTRHSEDAFVAFQHALACSGMKDKFGSMKCLQIKTGHELIVKKLEKRRQSIYHKLASLDGKTVESDCGKQIESGRDGKNVVSVFKERIKSGAKSYDALLDMVRAMRLSGVGSPPAA